MPLSSNRFVLVTGASTGIGEATALLLDQAGFHVFAGVRRTADAEALQSKASNRLVPVMLDVTDQESIQAAIETIAGQAGAAGLAGLVNNAGVAKGGPVEFIPLDAFRLQFEVNVFGQIAVTQACLPLLRAGGGRIVNIGSVGGLVSTPFQAPYNASKFALEALTDSLRVELRPWGIRVAIIEPGNIATPIWKRSLADFDQMSEGFPPETYTLYGSAITGVRKYIASKSEMLPPETVAQAVLHALTAEKPKTRYLIGKDARKLVMLGRLPDRLRDWIIARRLPKYGPQE